MNQDLIGAVKAVFDSFFERGRAPGLIYALFDRERIIARTRYGTASLERGNAITDATAFRIASMTKSFAAVAALRLRDAGRLSLDASAADLLPFIRREDGLGRHTVRELLCMSAELPTDDPWGDRQLGVTPRELDELLAGSYLRAAVGPLRCSYSNLGYMLLGRIIAAVAGVPAAEYISREILEPLGLTGTFWDPTAERDAAVGYVKRDEGWVPEPIMPCRADGVAFAGLWSTTNDIAAWMRFLGSPHLDSDAAHARILSADGRAELQQACTWMPPIEFATSETGETWTEYSHYGYGLRSHITGGLRSVGHSGGLPGFGSHMRWNQEAQLGIVALSNGTYCPVWEPCREALHMVSRAKFFEPLPVSNELAAGAARLVALVRDPSLLPAEDLFSMNFYMDHDRAELAREVRSVAEELGGAFTTSPLKAVGQTGQMVLTGNGRNITLDFSLAPTAAGLVQALKLTRG